MPFSTAEGNSGSETDATTATISSKATATTTTTTTTVAPSKDATTANSAEAEATTAAEELLKARFTKVEAKSKKNGNNGAFPWRSSPLLLDRLLPGTEDYHSRGMLLGGNLTASHPKWDGWATMVFFMEVPLWDSVLFRSSIEQDLAENMAWSFGETVRELVAAQQYDLGSTSEADNSVTKENESSTEEETLSSSRLGEMMEPTNLAKLFEAAREFGADSLEVKLDVQPILSSDNEGSDSGDADSSKNAGGIDEGEYDVHPELFLDGPKIVSLFVFPFLSRNMIANNRNPQHVRKYSKLLDAMTSSPSTEGEYDESEYQKSSTEWSRELMEDFREKGECENTIICQVLVPCKETFWVKDRASGEIVQGDPKPRIVYHLVRFEQITKTHFVRNSRKLFPFKHELGNWQITDIDDLCDGNQLL